MATRAYGTGSLRKRGHVWWIRYSVDGAQRDESSGSTKRSEAVRLLNKRLGQIATGRHIGTVCDRLTFDDLTGMINDHYHAKRSRKRAGRGLMGQERESGGG